MSGVDPGARSDQRLSQSAPLKARDCRPDRTEQHGAVSKSPFRRQGEPVSSSLPDVTTASRIASAGQQDASASFWMFGLLLRITIISLCSSNLPIRADAPKQTRIEKICELSVTDRRTNTPGRSVHFRQSAHENTNRNCSTYAAEPHRSHSDLNSPSVVAKRFLPNTRITVCVRQVCRTVMVYLSRRRLSDTPS